MKPHRPAALPLRLLFPLTLALMLLPLVLLAVGALYSLDRVAGSLDDQSLQMRSEILPIHHVQDLLGAADLALLDASHESLGEQSHFSAASHEVEKSFQTVVAPQSFDLPEEKELVQAAYRSWKTAQTLGSRLLERSSPTDDSLRLEELNRASSHIHQAMAKLNQAQGLALQQTHKGLEESASAKRTVIYLIATVFLAGAAIALAAGLALGQSVLSPVRALSEGVSRLAEGDLSHRVPVRREDELGQLAQAFNVMAERLAQSQEALRESEDRYRDLVENSRDLMCTHDLEGRILTVNGAFLRLMGYTQEQLVGRNIREFLVPAVRDGFEGYLTRLKTDGHAEGLMNVLTASGERLVLEYNNSLRTAGVVEPVVRGLAREVTDRIRAQAELARAKELAEAATLAKSEFLANMSHEIRTPMNAIIGMTDLALETSLTAEQLEYLTVVKDSGQSLLGIIDDVLDTSKIEAGKLELDHTAFRLYDAADDALRALAARAQKKGLELAADISPEVPEVVVGDAMRLRQVLTNLLGNAIKFTEQGEVVLHIKTQEQDAHEVLLQFSVADTGIGIPPEKQQVIFEPFAQADTSTTRKYGGTGLGLTICSHLVRLMGGRIWVESEVGKGTTFHFTARFGLAKEVAAQAPAPDAVSLRGLHVLVVDDNATNRRILQTTLASWQMQPVSAANAWQGLRLLEQAQDGGKPFRLLLLDSQMPVMDGFGLAAQIRKHPALSSLAIILLTSAGSPGDAARCHELSIAAYLTKPVRRSDLFNTMQRVLGGEPPGEDRTAWVALPAPGEKGRALRILLCEDDAYNQMLAVRLLEKRSHAVVVVPNGRKAIAALETAHFDVVLMDMQMPEMSGFDATMIIRQKEEITGGHVPIIAMTALAMKGDRERCLAAGMDGYLSKPIQAEKLFQALDRLLPAPAAEAGPEPAVAAPLDKAALLAAVAGDEELLAELIRIFVGECPSYLARMRCAVAAGDAATLERAAHTLKGRTAQFGIKGATETLGELERMGHEGAVDGAEALLTRLEPQLAALQSALASIAQGQQV